MWFFVTSLFISLLSVFTYWIWFIPLNRIRTVDSHNLKFLKRNTVNRIRKSRKRGKLPPSFPNGWYVIAESREIGKGEMKYVSALGEHLVAFRGTETGEIFVVDAYCPHLGANLSAGGKVEDDTILCPFHSWSFSGETGQCVKIPYAQKIPNFARVKKWKSVETNGLIYAWYHISEDEPPTWFPISLSNYGTLTYQGRTEYEIGCHIQDICENGADVAHLNAIHRTSILMGGQPDKWWEDLTANLLYHEWDINWKVDADNPHVANVKLSHELKCFSKLSLLNLRIHAVQIGPSVVHLHFHSPFFGNAVMIQSVLPLEPMLQRVVHVFYTERFWPAPYAKFVLWGEAVLFERDVTVWNSKTYVDKPVLVQEDALILRHRRWYSQFYSPDSLRLGENGAKEW